MKTVEFTKKHIYGGIPFEADDRLECPDDRAALLVAPSPSKKTPWPGGSRRSEASARRLDPWAVYPSPSPPHATAKAHRSA